jgi:hypothetical protein
MFAYRSSIFQGLRPGRFVLVESIQRLHESSHNGVKLHMLGPDQLLEVFRFPQASGILGTSHIQGPTRELLILVPLSTSECK